HNPPSHEAVIMQNYQQQQQQQQQPDYNSGFGHQLNRQGSRQQLQQQPYQQQNLQSTQPPYQQYNHYNNYQPGSQHEIQNQRLQYQQMQLSLQQQQQNQIRNGERPISTHPPLNSLRDWFNAVDTDGSGDLTCEELQRALMNGDGWTPFNVETVRMMINMFDRDGNGSISFNEFIGLWNYIEKWKRCFQAYDLDGSGTIDTDELQKALLGFGYNIGMGTVELIMTRYDVRGKGEISFDNFVQSCVTIQTLSDAFRRIDVAGKGVVTMTYEQFLGLVISNR
ncbi:Alpha-1 3/1 6-mannosyltransferase alg-2, partial [Entomortierella beljakovae]